MFDPDFIPASRFAIAFSGGGDSTALVHMLRDKNPLILIVDHALREGSKKEAEQAHDFAQGLGLETKVLTWTHDTPKTGLQEKARKARYGLMGNVCRKLGIKFLLTAHSEGDQAETLMMRYERNTDWRGAAGIAKAVYAPVWPELAEVTLVRPLLGVTRKALREYNRENNLSWIEDPSNENRKFTRIRARDILDKQPSLKKRLLYTAKQLRNGLDQEKAKLRSFYNRHGSCDENGILSLNQLPPSRLLHFALRAASGTGGAIPARALQDLKEQMRREDKFTGYTLASAYICYREAKFYIGRDPVAAKGRYGKPAIQRQSLAPNQSMIWDGRFAIKAHGRSAEISTRLLMSETDPKPAHKLKAYEMSLPVSSGGKIMTRTLVASRLQKMLMNEKELMIED